jgi:hypothetical protein
MHTDTWMYRPQIDDAVVDLAREGGAAEAEARDPEKVQESTFSVTVNG